MRCFSQGCCCCPNRKSFSHLLCSQDSYVAQQHSDPHSKSTGGSNSLRHCTPTARKPQRRSYAGPSTRVAKLLAWELTLADSAMTCCTDERVKEDAFIKNT
ncbi:hypothetical protein CHARACLAT_032030 [Characodon lateralis]|uniref:Uncharacterized protein n=1 Tax=Characodon lateralis TaxID=208331 RepID=A0ABU7DBS7_9TELE|nr:hypothetical protein [Characodon lateralis]